MQAFLKHGGVFTVTGEKLVVGLGIKIIKHCLRSPGFGSIIYDLCRPFQTRSRFGSVPYIVLNLAIYNNSLDRSTKSTISHLNVLYLLVNIGFQVLFHSPPGVLFTFPSRYCFTIGHQVVFSLMGWSPHIHTRFHVPRITLDTIM